MKKLISILITLFLIGTITAIKTTASDENNTEISKNEEVASNLEIDLLPAMASESDCPNRVWVGTFQLAWNELMDEVVQKPIKFTGENSLNVTLLNKKSFSQNDLRPNSYYVKSGEVSPELKDEIETAIKEKFNETSDILNDFDWSEDPQKLFVYAMLKKDFKFLKPFNKLTKSSFGKNNNLVDYFGINKNSSRALYKNVRVLFYNDYNDFAVKLLTKGNDYVLLYRTDDDKTFNKYYEELTQKAEKYEGDRNYKSSDTLRIPDITLYLKRNFPEFEGRRIKGTRLYIDSALETVDFKMNKTGVKLKSEAGIMTRLTALAPDNNRHFEFTDNFVVFLIEKNRKNPYYGMKIQDIEVFNKTAK